MKNKSLFCCVIVFSLVISIFMSNVKVENETVVVELNYNIPVLMYHFFTRSSSKAGKYTITATRLESDLKYISENYVSITSKDLIEYKQGDKSLPYNSIVITVDDSSLSFYTIMFPLLVKYNIKVILNVVGKYSDDNNGFHMTWRQIKEVEASSLVELGSHSYDLHEYGDGRYAMKKYDNETLSDYFSRIENDLEKNNALLESLNGINPVSFAYPLGYSNKTLKGIIKKSFSISFSCRETLYDINDLYDIPRFNRDGILTTEQFFHKIYS